MILYKFYFPSFGANNFPARKNKLFAMIFDESTEKPFRLNPKAELVCEKVEYADATQTCPK